MVADSTRCRRHRTRADLAKVAIGRVAARRLGPGGHGYIEDLSAWQYRLTPAGRAYLAAHSSGAHGESD